MSYIQLNVEERNNRLNKFYSKLLFASIQISPLSIAPESL